MEALAALGVASNIVSFVDFSWKLVAGAHQIYKSASETSNDSYSLETLATSIIRLDDGMAVVNTVPENLRKLSNECRAVAKDLLVAIEKLRIKGKCKRWESFVAALKEVWSQRRINGIVGRLQRLQSQLLVQMQFTMLDQQSSVVRELAKIDDTNKRLEMERNQVLDRLKQDISSELENLKESCSHRNLDSASTQLRDSQRINPDTIAELSDRLQNLSLHLGQLEKQSRCTVSNHQFLRSLYFERLTSRHDNIEPAHAKTFDWIFKNSQEAAESPTGFVEWLRSKHGSYWIRGKAGSGKSTLMKYIWHHPSTIHHLQHWAGSDHKLITASYFFWSTGSELQNSQHGLLQTLLFEVLRSCPELIERVRESTYQVYDWVMFPRVIDWHLATLKKMWHVAIEQDLPLKFCFFIDGLDEYGGNNYGLIQLVKALAAYPHVKVCVSSRPWTEFNHAFGQDISRVTKLEDLTAGDIRRYVDDHLNGNVQFKLLKKNDARYESLANEVVKRAQGVFLWVFLVVRSLKEGTLYSDSIDEMHHRLDTFPEDLEGFFKQMLYDIPAFYRQHTSITFKVALAAAAPLPLEIYGLVDELVKQPLFALSPFVEKELQDDINVLPNRLDARSKGFLEVVKRADPYPCDAYEVDFLHRTARDFLTASVDAQMMFQQDLTENFNPSLMLCHAFLADLKLSLGTMHPLYACDNSARREELDELDVFMYRPVQNILTYARQAQQVLDNVLPLVLVLDEVERVLLTSTTPMQQTKRRTRFLGNALQYELLDYVERRLIQSTQEEKRLVLSGVGKPLLSFILPLPGSAATIDPAAVKVLLEHGADPNEEYMSSTVWIVFLDTCVRCPAFAEETSTRDIINLLIRHNADLAGDVPVPDAFMRESLTLEKTRWVKRKVAGPKSHDIRSSTADITEPETSGTMKARDVIGVLYPNSDELLFRPRSLRISLKHYRYVITRRLASLKGVG